jgi:hypothetical protein
MIFKHAQRLVGEGEKILYTLKKIQSHKKKMLQTTIHGDCSLYSYTLIL